METKSNKPNQIIEIPTLNSFEQFEKNRSKAEMFGEEHCPCCGKLLLNPQYFVQSIYGGSMYPKSDKNFYNDAWVVGIGSECRKQIPTEYLMTQKELKDCTI